MSVDEDRMITATVGKSEAETSHTETAAELLRRREASHVSARGEAPLFRNRASTASALAAVKESRHSASGSLIPWLHRPRMFTTLLGPLIHDGIRTGLDGQAPTDLERFAGIAIET